jgi:hypothetical protein
MTAESGGFTGITRRNRPVSAGNGAKNVPKSTRLSSAERRGQTPPADEGEKPLFTARFAPHHGPGTRQRRSTAPDYGKPAVLSSLIDSAKRGHRRGAPGCLRRGSKIGGFLPRLCDKTAESGGFTGITRRNRPVSAGNGAKNVPKSTRLSSAERRGQTPQGCDYAVAYLVPRHSNPPPPHPLKAPKRTAQAAGFTSAKRVCFSTVHMGFARYGTRNVLLDSK